MEVWDMGIVYVLTNVWDKRTVDSIGNNAVDSNGTASNLVANKNTKPAATAPIFNGKE
jgi:hypothetical protein